MKQSQSTIGFYKEYVMKKEELFSKKAIFKKGSASGHFPVSEVNMELVEILKEEIM